MYAGHVAILSSLQYPITHASAGFSHAVFRDMTDKQTQNHCFTLSKMDMASISVTGKSVWSSVTTGYTTPD